MMLLEGNGFIKGLTPMKATVWSHVEIYKLLCLELAFFFPLKFCFLERNSALQ